MDGTPIAFSFFLQEDDKGKVVSIHGGGWEHTVRDTLLYYRGFVLLLLALLNTGIKVRIVCRKENEVADRFVRSVGFVQYADTQTNTLFWINKRRLLNSKIYKRIFNNKKI